LIEESRREIEEMHRKDSTLQASIEGRVNLGGCSNFPVARSVRKYTYIHKKNVEKPAEAKEGNEGKDQCAEWENEGNFINGIIHKTS
jgi:hypothetical protein